MPVAVATQSLPVWSTRLWNVVPAGAESVIVMSSSVASPVLVTVIRYWIVPSGAVEIVEVTKSPSVPERCSFSAVTLSVGSSSTISATAWLYQQTNVVSSSSMATPVSEVGREAGGLVWHDSALWTTSPPRFVQPLSASSVSV
jgi:hypothetical protein